MPRCPKCNAQMLPIGRGGNIFSGVVGEMIYECQNNHRVKESDILKKSIEKYNKIIDTDKYIRLMYLYGLEYAMEEFKKDLDY